MQEHISLSLLGLVVGYVLVFGVTFKMAKNRHRDPRGWILLSLVVTPLLTWILLLIVGDSSADGKKYATDCILLRGGVKKTYHNETISYQ